MLFIKGLENCVQFVFLLSAVPNLLTVSFAQETCGRQSDCYSNSKWKCGICVDSKTGGSQRGRCVFPFSYMFKNGRQCEPIKECECSNAKRCMTTDTIPDIVPSCYCNKGFYGDQCQYKTPKNLDNYMLGFVGYEFINSVKPFYFDYHVVHLYCDYMRESTTAYFTLETDEGYFCQYRNSPFKQCFDTGSAAYQIPVRFPYKPLNEINNNVLKLGNEVLGYLSYFRHSFTLTQMYPAYISSKRFPVFVSYQEADLICVPVIEIMDCASSFDKIVEYRKMDQVQLESSVEFIANGRYVSSSVVKPDCSDNVSYKWKIWRNVQLDLDKYLVFEIYKAKSFTRQPFELLEGEYRVLLEVEKVQRKSSRNFAYCYFRVVLQPMVAIIEGTSERTIVRKSGLTLDSHQSYDPNMARDNQTHVWATWSCKDISSSSGSDICLFTKPVYERLFIPSERLNYGAVYKVTLTIWTNIYEDSASLTSQANTVVVVAQTDKDFDLLIECLLNCKETVLTNQQIYLKARSNKGIEGDYIWTYYEEGQTIESDTKNISIKGVQNNMLIVRENALDEGKKYTIAVRVSGLTAKFSFVTKKVVFHGNCSVSPSAGTRGLSLFDIICENFTSPLTYEFYDKYPDEAAKGVIFNGRMIGTPYTGKLEDVHLTRGVVCIYIYDDSGIFTFKQYSINLSQWNVDGKVLDEMFHNLTQKVETGIDSATLRYISFISDVVPNDANKSKILNILLDDISSISINSLAEVKQSASTLAIVLQNLNKPTQLGISAYLLKDTIEIIKKGTDLFSEVVRKRQVRGMSPNEIKLVATAQLNCLSAALACRDLKTENINEFEYNSKVLGELMESTQLIVNTIDSIKDTLTFLQVPGQPPTKIASENDSYVILVAKSDKEYDLTKYFNEKENTSVIISELLMKELSVYGETHLSLQMATIQDNIFWWCKSDVKSSFLSVSIAASEKEKKDSKLVKIKDLGSREISLLVKMNHDIESTKISGTTFLPDSNLDEEEQVKIHRLDPSPKSLLSLKFLYPQTNGSLLVVVKTDRRPEFDEVNRTKYSQQVNKTHPVVTFGSEFANSLKQKFIYVGILPAHDALANKTISYTFEVNTTFCQYWAGGEWSSAGCEIKQKEDLSVKCDCFHLSIFAAAFPVPPQEVDPFADAKLFLTFLDNPLVVSFVAAMLLLYFLLCFWAWRKDKFDRKLRNVIVLDDNFPDDCYPYLMAVYTSSRFNSGTTANVGIKINGELADSRAHILRSKDRKVLKKNYDDWFLIFCPDHLGIMKNIHIWHDNAGSSPDWFAARIVIYDLTQSVQAVFVIDQWLALRINEYPEAKVLPASIVEVQNVKRIFVNNFVLGMRQTHSLLSIILRHPRSNISRVQRISVYMCLFMTTMLCSIMFYNPPGDQGPDDSHYSVGTRDLYISIESLVISLSLTFFVLIAFSKSYIFKEDRAGRPKFSMLQRKSVFEERQSLKTSLPKNTESSIYRKFVRYVTRAVKSQPLVPAKLASSERLVEVRKKWLIFAWVSCVTVIFVCSYFVMLYGLKLGKVKSSKWLSSVFLTLAEDSFVVGPAKIIFFAVILSTAFQKVCEEDTHQVTLRDAMALETPSGRNYVDQLVAKRNHAMYAPLHYHVRLQMIKKKELINNWWTVVDFTVALLFIFVVSAVIFRLWSSHYHSNAQIVNIMTESHHMGSQGFFTSKYVEHVESYLQNSYLNALYQTFSYNNMPIKMAEIKIYWSEDFTYTTIGLQQLRQLRVQPTECKLKYVNTTGRQCIPLWSEEDEDNNNYMERWKPLFRDASVTTPWIYKTDYTSKLMTSYRLYGASGRLFKNGGYSTLLGPTRNNIEKTMLELNDNDWQDHLTKVLILEFTLYNVNLDLFSQVTMIVEYMRGGTIQHKVVVTSTESHMKVELWVVLFVVFVVYYIVRSGYLINRLGFIEYLKSSRNRSRLVIVAFGVLCIVTAIVHYYKSTSYFKIFVNSGPESYFNFDVFIFYFIALQLMLSILLAVAMFRTVGIFRGGRLLLNHMYTLWLSLKWVIWLVLMLLLFFLVQLYFFLLLNIFGLPNIQEMILDPKSFRYFAAEDFNYGHIRVLFVAKTLFCAVAIGLFIVIFMHYAKLAKTYRLRKTDNFNIILFVIKSLTKKLTKDGERIK